MMRRIDRYSTPPGGWRYNVDTPYRRFEGTQHTLYSISTQITDYLNANHLPVPPDLKERIEDFTCRELYGSGCEETDPVADFKARFKMGWEVLRAGTVAIGSWILSGRPLVPQPQADARSETCSRCAHNVDPVGCQPCQVGALHTLVNSIIGGRKSSQHERLKACDRCGCSLRVKVFVPLEHLTKVPPVAPLPEWCWITKETAS